MKPASHILQKVRRSVQSFAYGNPLYQKILAAGETPERLFFTKADPWPGDAQAGMELLSDQRSMFDVPAGINMRHSATVLRNLRAVGTDAARQMSVYLIDNWIRQHESWSEAEWAPHVLGERIAAWISFYEFYAPALSPAMVPVIATSLYRQWKHLLHAIPSSMVGMAGLQALRGLLYGGLNFPEGDKALGLACDLLQRQVAAEILPDGGHISRNPSMLFHVLRHLVDINAILEAAELDMPSPVSTAIAAMIPALKMFRHGDNGLALFHGSAQESSLLIDAVLTQAEVRSRVLRRLPHTGYERLTSGRSLLLMDVMPPPSAGYDRAAHAGVLSFEFGHGRERLIVNCGAMDNSPEWHVALAATAAHSTLTVADTNACSVNEGGGISYRPQVTAHRYELDETEYVEASHNGYYDRLGLHYTRVLGLGQGGEVLSGKETLSGFAERDYAVRWHLHPSVQVSLTQGGVSALLRTAGGAGWRLSIACGQLSMEPSIYCGEGHPQRSYHLKASNRMTDSESVLHWKLVREKK